MPCSSSSNIKSTATFINVTQGGSRLMLSIPTGYYAAGVTAGDVIRYSVPDTQYVKSKADALANSEVVGIVESKSGTSLNVVIYGSINLPASSIETTTPSSDTTSGGGGDDIYFLSATTSGKVRVLAPTGQSDIIKPIYQVAPHGLGAYTGIVMNYIGYKIGGDVQAYLQGGFDGGIGTISTVIGGASNGIDETNQLPTFYVDASIRHILPISEYPGFWNRYVKSLGYQDIVTTSLTALSTNIGQRITPSTGKYSGTIRQTIPPNRYLVERPPNGITGNANDKIIINGVAQTITYTTENYASLTPILIPSPTTIITDGVTHIINRIITGIKVAGEGTTITVPESITISSITTDALIVGASGGYNLDTTVQDLTTRIVTLESKIH